MFARSGSIRSILPLIARSVLLARTANMVYAQSQSHTAASWARVNHDLQFRSVVAKVESLAEETRRTQTQEAESRQAIGYLQARLHALAAAVGELPAVFQGSVREVVAEQERLRADLVLCRQQMREHRTEVTSILEEARRASHAAVEAEHAAVRERLGAVESLLEAAVTQQQKLHAEAIEWDQQRRRLEHEEARTAEVRQRVHAVAPRLEGVEDLLHEHAQQLQQLQRARESADASAQAQAAHDLARARDARAVQQKLDGFTHALRVLSERLDVPLPMLGS